MAEKSLTLVVRQVYFMIMPFVTKSTGPDDGTDLKNIDFDALWYKAFNLVIEYAGYMGGRTDVL